LIAALISLSGLACPSTVQAGSGAGTEAASFLDIPVGGRPAAMGDAYAALASDAYAMTSNPGGLAFLNSTQLAGQHLSYLESIHYEYLSFVHPLQPGSAAGVSMQYLGSGDITQTAPSGETIGQYSTYFAAYSAAYGHTVGERLGLGATVKVIDARISNVGARAYAADAGAFYRARPDLNLAAVVTNTGTQLTFLQDGGTLPLAAKIAAAYAPNNHFTLSVQGVYPKTGLASGHVGVEWQPMDMIALRAGYRTDTTKELGTMAGFSTGLGIKVAGQELSYAWVPYGDLGSTQYFSFVARFGAKEEARRNLIQYQTLKRSNATERKMLPNDPEYEQLMQLLSDIDNETYTRNSAFSGNVQ
jgi:hypothetical protein